MPIKRFNALPLRIIPDWFEGTPFDMVGLAAIAVGTAIAFFVMLMTNKAREIT